MSSAEDSTEKVVTDAMCKSAQTELQKLIQLINFEAEVETFVEDDCILLHISTSEANRLIGRGARTLEALQYILNRILRTNDKDFTHCIVDVERYRERKKDKLVRTALDAADQARKTGDIIVLPAMHSSDRRVIHETLKKQENIITNSQESDNHGRKCIEVSCTDDEYPETTDTQD